MNTVKKLLVCALIATSASTAVVAVNVTPSGRDFKKMLKDNKVTVRNGRIGIRRTFVAAVKAQDNIAKAVKNAADKSEAFNKKIADLNEDQKAAIIEFIKTAPAEKKAAVVAELNTQFEKVQGILA